MPLRLWRRVKIAPGITLNISKRGVSTSIGPRGAKVTFGHGRIRRTLGLPGTGLFYTTTSNLSDGAASTTSAEGGEPQPGVEGDNATPPPARRRSRVGCLGWTFGLLAVLAFIGTLAGSPSAGPSLTPYPGTGGDSASTSSPVGIVWLPTFVPPATAGATVAPTPTGAPTPRPTSSPKPTPKPTVLAVRITKAPGTVSRNSYATLSARTHAGARCSIVVEYASGPSKAAGLGPKTASSTGSVSWTWKIGGSTTTGTWPIYVTCTWGGQQAEATSQVTVR